MKPCEFYEELISRLVDGELNREEYDALLAHIGECSRCNALYTAFNAMSDLMREDPAPLPEGLHENIMAGVRRSAIEKKNRRMRTIWTRTALTAAACLALVLFASKGFAPDKKAESVTLRSREAAEEILPAVPAEGVSAPAAIEEEAAPAVTAEVAAEPAATEAPAPTAEPTASPAPTATPVPVLEGNPPSASTQAPVSNLRPSPTPVPVLEGNAPTSSTPAPAAKPAPTATAKPAATATAKPAATATAKPAATAAPTAAASPAATVSAAPTAAADVAAPTATAAAPVPETSAPAPVPDEQAESGHAENALQAPAAKAESAAAAAAVEAESASASAGAEAKKQEAAAPDAQSKSDGDAAVTEDSAETEEPEETPVMNRKGLFSMFKRPALSALPELPQETDNEATAEAEPEVSEEPEPIAPLQAPPVKVPVFHELEISSDAAYDELLELLALEKAAMPESAPGTIYAVRFFPGGEDAEAEEMEISIFDDEVYCMRKSGEKAWKTYRAACEISELKALLSRLENAPDEIADEPVVPVLPLPKPSVTPKPAATAAPTAAPEPSASAAPSPTPAEASAAPTEQAEAES